MTNTDFPQDLRKYENIGLVSEMYLFLACTLNILEELNHSRIIKIHQQSLVAVTVSMYFQDTGTKGDNKEG